MKEHLKKQREDLIKLEQEKQKTAIEEEKKEQALTHKLELETNLKKELASIEVDRLTKLKELAEFDRPKEAIIDVNLGDEKIGRMIVKPGQQYDLNLQANKEKEN